MAYILGSSILVRSFVRVLFGTLALLLSPADAFAQDKYVISTVHRDVFKVLGFSPGDVAYELPLPDGDWTLVAEEIWLNAHGNPFRRLSLAKIFESRVVAAIYIFAYVSEKHTAIWNDEPCANRAIFKNEYDSSPLNRRCLSINSSHYKVWSNIKMSIAAGRYYSEKGIEAPLESMAANVEYSHIGYRGRYLFLRYSVFPQFYGLENPIVADPKDSPWNMSVANEEISRREFLSALMRYGERYAISLESAYMRTNEKRVAMDSFAFRGLTEVQYIARSSEDAKRRIAQGSQRLDDLAKSQAAAEQDRVVREANEKEALRLAQARAAEEEALLVKEAKFREESRLAELAVSRENEKARIAAEVAMLKEDTARNSSSNMSVSGRKALVIGNDSYRLVPKLLNAREDAKTMAEGLSKVGYTVTLRLDLSEKEMKAALRTFRGQVNPGDDVAFFFAGHGVQLASSNFLLPVDVGGDGEDQVRDEAIPLQRIIDDMRERRARFTLAVIDACRDNPFASNSRGLGDRSRGLAPTYVATGQMIIFSAGTGQKALDRLNALDKDRNGVFTRVFVKEMEKPGVSVDKVLRNVRNEVVRITRAVGHEQVPAIYDQVVGDFYFRH